MWVPANLVFFGIATFLFARWTISPKPPDRLATGRGGDGAAERDHVRG